MTKETRPEFAWSKSAARILAVATVMKWLAVCAVGIIAAGAAVGSLLPGDSGHLHSTWRQLGFDAGIALLTVAAIGAYMCYWALVRRIPRR